MSILGVWFRLDDSRQKYLGGARGTEPQSPGVPTL